MCRQPRDLPSVAKARSLVKAGQQVHITDEHDRTFQPNRFEELLRFDGKPPVRF
jgi:hypothetical protein